MSPSGITTSCQDNIGVALGRVLMTLRVESMAALGRIKF